MRPDRSDKSDPITERYEVRRLIARDDRCELLAGEHRFTGRPVAIKRLLGLAKTDSAVCDPFLREIRLLGTLRHRAVVEALDAGLLYGGGPYLVTEMLDGRTLDGLLASRGSLPADEAIAMTLAIADALAQAESQGVVHGRLSPASIFLPAPRADEPTIAAKLLDFGLSPNPMASVETSLLAVGYASPERLAGEPASARCDVYSLAAIAVECLAGAQPSAGAMPPLDTPATVSEVLARALGEADRRQQSPAQLAAELRHACRAEPPVSAPPSSRRRAHPRAAYICPVRLLRHDGSHVDARSEDISQSGMLLLGTGGLFDAERVQVRFPLPSSGRILTLDAIVRWARGGDERCASGLEFQNVPEDVRDEIAAYAQFFSSRD